jgi:hypothetical protein
MKDLQESMKVIDRGEKHGRDDEHEDEDAHVYKLIRGAPTVMFTQRGDDCQEYRPKWEDDLEGDSDGEKVKPVNRGQRQTKRRNVRFSVTLKATSKRESKVYSEEEEDSDEEGKPVSAPGAESPRCASTPSPPSLEHFRGGFKLSNKKSPKETGKRQLSNRKREKRLKPELELYGFPGRVARE